MKKNLITLCSLLLVKIVDSCKLTVVSLRTPNKLSTVNYKLSTIFAFCFLPFIISAQTITVEVLIAPPVASHVTDYINQNVLKITNSSTVPMSIYLKGTLTSDNGISGKTKDGYRPKRPIVVPPNNQPLILQATQQNGVDFTDNKNLDYVSGNYSIANIVRTGVVPEGNYTLCISAYDYITNELKSRNDAAFNCRTFNIILPQPPTIDCDINVPTLNGTQRLLVGDKNDAFNPIAQNPTFIRFNWLPTNANGKAIIVAYDLYLLKLQDGQNGQDALTAAIRNKQNNPIKFSDIRTTQYDAILAISPSLVAGRYAWAVVAKDGGGGQTVFENNGVSTICEFEWKTPVMANVAKAPAPIVAADIKPSCDECKLSIPQGNVSTYELKIGDNVNIGNHTFRINSVGADHAKGWSGTARIAIKIAGISAIPFLVDFSNLTFVKTGDKLNAKTGTAKVQTHPGAPSFVPKFSKPDMPSLMDVKPEDALAFDDYLSKNVDQTLKGYKENFNNSGLQVPFGIGGDNGAPTLSIVNITFTPEFSWFDALAGMQIGDNPGMIAFGASGVCLRADGDGLCGNAVLYLANDLVIDALNFKLLGANGHDLKDACYLKITDSKVQEGQFVGQFDFPDNKLVRADGKPERVIAEARFKATSWSDWMAEVTIPDFKIKGAEDFTFHTSKATYDHSDLINPKGMPDDYNDAKNNTAWHGFFLPDLNVDIPGVFNTVDNKQIKVGVKNLIIDNTGNITVKIYADNVISIGDGSLDGWGYSLDHLEANFYKSDFQNGSFKGKFLLPITDKKVQYALDYTGLFTYHNDLKKDKLKYTFTVAPDANRELDVQMWAAKLKIGGNSNIKVSNENDENKFHAEAHLYGEMSVNTKDITIPGVSASLPAFNLADLKFQNLYLKSFKDPKKPYDKYFGVDSTAFTTGFASPPKSAGGFPLSITSFEWAPDLMGANASFKIGVALAFAGKESADFLKATGDFIIKGNVDVPLLNGGTWKPELKGLGCDGIDVHGKIGPVRLDGGVLFFKGNATWGDGVRGMMIASALDGKIQLGNAVAQFSNKNGVSSWFVDAKINQGFTFVPSLKINALGGGAAYNVSVSTPIDPKAIKEMANKPAPNDLPKTKEELMAFPLGKTISGIVYAPASDGKFAFNAQIAFGIVSNETFNADASLAMSFGSSGGVETIKFNGTGRFLQPDLKNEKCLAKAILDVNYDKVNEIFEASLGLKMNDGLLPFDQAYIHLYFAPGDLWHIMLGRPESVTQIDGEKSVVINLIPNFAKAYAYFQVGTIGLDGRPPLPRLIREILSESSKSFNEPLNTRDNAMLTGSGVAFGASLKVHLGGKVGPLYGNLDGQIGFDLLLAKVNGGCNGQSQIGIGGWYANGQIYAGVRADIGIDVDLGFWHDKFSILNAGAAAILEGGGPNPLWGKGFVSGYMNILDGLIHGDFQYNFSLGQECIPDNDVLKNIKIVSQISPAAGSTIEIDGFPTVAFNFPLDKDFDIIVKKGYNGKPDDVRTFRLSSNKIKFALTDKVTNSTVSVVSSVLFGNYSVDLKPVPQKFFEKNHDIEFKISITMDEKISGFYNPAMSNGKVFVQDTVLNYKTNNGFDSLRVREIVDMAPVWNQRYFTPGDATKAFIRLKTTKNPSDFNVPQEVQSKTKVWVRFIEINAGKNGSAFEKQISGVGSDTWSYSLDNINPEKMYAVQFLLRWPAPTPPSNGGGPVQQGTVLRTLSTFNILGNNYTQSDRAINTASLKLSGNEKEIFRYAFKASKFRSYIEKLAALHFREMIFGQDDAGKPKSLLVYDQTTLPLNLNQLYNTEFPSSDGKSVLIIPSETNFYSNDENFDEADVNGINYTTDSKTGKLVVKDNTALSLAPRVNLINSDLKDWTYGVISAMLNAMKNLRYEDTVKLKSQLSRYDAANVYADPDPLLTASEITGGSAPRLKNLTKLSVTSVGSSPSGFGKYVGSQFNIQLIPRNILGVLYGISQTNFVAGGGLSLDGILGFKLWAVNPASNQTTTTYQSIGNALDAGMNASQKSLGMSLGASIGGLNIKTGLIAH